MSWNKEDFINFILDNKIIGFFEKAITLKSGRYSYWYINWRNATEDVYLLDKLTDYIIEYISYLNIKPDTFYGVPEGGTKLGLITQYKWAKKKEDLSKGKYVLSMGRALPKDHGDPKDKFFLGEPRGKVIIVEDTVTTGESLLNTVMELIDFNINIIAIVCLSNRNEIRDDGKYIGNMIEDLNIRFFAMSDAVELLPLAIKRFQIGRKIALKVQEYFNQYGMKKVNLDINEKKTD